MSTAVEALQSNEVYLPRMRQRQGRTLSARQINAIRWATHMLGWQKRRILMLGSLLRALENDRSDLSLLLKLQLAILTSLRTTERNLQRNQTQAFTLKQRLRTQRLPKEDAGEIKVLIRECRERVDHHRWLLTVWRAFGDGIAFLYLDKWAVKPLLYNLGNPDEKSPAGSIRGKLGLQNEIRILKVFLERGIPAVLNDITNCIRHGDICLLGGSDPFLVEVKSSKNTNTRTDRQIANIQSIHEYHRTDLAQNVRGVPEIMRVALSRHEVHYQALLNKGIETALTTKYCSFEPEAGMRLVVLASGSKKVLDQAFSGFRISTLQFWNEAKNEGHWGVYYPYVLSIRSLDNLYAFLSGQVYVTVAYDFEAIRKVAKRYSLALTTTDDQVWPIQLEWLGSAQPELAYVRLSSHFLGRMAGPPHSVVIAV